MTHLLAIVLGAVEGFSEFIPISSSGHLIIVRQLLGVNDVGGLTFDAVLQLATSCALLVYFWRDIVKLFFTFLKILSRPPEINIDSTNFQKDKIMFWSVVIGTIPAMIFGLFLEEYMETIFRNVQLIALTLLAGSLLFWLAQKFAKKDKVLTLGRGIVIGFFQCLALVPGISRSGATISGGLFSGLTQEDSVRFSFLLSIPILFGAGLKKLFEIGGDLFTTGYGSSLFLGSITVFVTGLISINFLIKYLKNHNLNLFIYYRIALSIAIFLLF